MLQFADISGVTAANLLTYQFADISGFTANSCKAAGKPDIGRACDMLE
jgi:hypothetical protein